MIIGISGRARHGKDTLGKMLAEQLYERTGYTYVLMSFAYELKVKVQKDFDMSWDQLWGDEKEIPDRRYSRPDAYIAGRRDHDELPCSTYWTPREIMQEYGVFFRKIKKDYWVDHLFNIINEKEYKNVIITDCRFKNEVNKVVDSNGYHLRVFRNIGSLITNETHESETSLGDSYKVDFQINNTGTLEDLNNTAADVVKFLIDNGHSKNLK